ncbi:cation-transporting ATPase [Exophiala dermatitidis]
MDVVDRGRAGPPRRSSSALRTMHRRDSNLSNASIVSEVEMATDEPFSGPISESVPSSVTGFVYQRPRKRKGSISSFTYFQDEEETPDYSDEEAIVDLSDEEDGHIHGEERDLEAGQREPLRHKPSGRLRSSSDQPLLGRRGSARSDTQELEEGGNFSQKLYIETEDLTMVIAGFVTSSLGYLAYLAICILTGGIGYLVFRWIPRWRISLVGTAAPLKNCSWVVVENQWGEFTVHYVAVEEYGHPMSTVFTRSGKEKHNGYRYDEDVELPLLRFLDYRYMRLLYHPVQDKFVLNNDWWDPQWTSVKALREGLDSEERDPRDQVFGKNVIEIQQKTIPELLLDEAFHPFYVFQVASLILWSLDEYYYYAAAIFLISVFSITTTVIETRSTMQRLREISRFECDVRVLRNGFWRSALSSELVPGDVYEVSDPSLSVIPCDSLLLSGDCIINESMLTGESIPVSKIPIVDEALPYINLGATSIHPSVARYFLFCGTKIIRARRPQDTDDDEAVALAMVVRTGFNTTKGALVRSMLFPKPSGFKFYRDSFRYISVMGCVAGVGFIASFINFVKLGLAWHLIIVRALDLITIVVPPALPATLTIGTNFALSRLRKQQIFCISPQRVNVAGKLDVVCFDKTGTLTEDGLDVLGVRLVQHPEIRFGDILEEAHEVLPPAPYDRDPTVDYRVNKNMLYAMATCHSLRLVDDELIGDPLDLKMFQFTGWSFEEGSRNTNHFIEPGTQQTAPSVARPPPGLEYDVDDSQDNANPVRVELGVLRSFEFVSHLRRASVVVRQHADPGASIYVKGAPEVMKDICTPSSIPDDFDDLLSYYTHKGFRVIACASKYVSRLSWDEIQNMDRSEAESRLQLLGFIIFENKLKEITTEIIEELNEARIRNVMCTGDNILTAISVARECQLVDRNAHCFVAHFVEGDKMDPRARLTWEAVDNPIYQLDENTLLPLPLLAEDDTSSPYDAIAIGDYTLAVTGDAFRWIIDFAPTEVVERMLVKGAVFARMSPDEKHELVEKLQSIDYCCGFCGDGANDCGALKAADVGVSLSEAEASVAAPFTSHIFDISCVPALIKEGRAALVTSFCCFKYMSLYSAIQFTSVSFLYASASNLGDFQFLFIDLCLILPIAIFMGWTGAYPVLSKKRPTANLVSRKVLTPLLGQIVLAVLVQLVAYETVQEQPWYQPPELNKEKSNVDNSLNTALFLVSIYQYTLSGVVLSIGPPFRQSMMTNVPFCVTIVVALLMSLYMLLDPAKWLADFMDLTEMSLDYELFLLALAAAGFAVSYLSERHFFQLLAKYIGRLKLWLRPAHPKKRKRYKIIAEDILQSK